MIREHAKVIGHNITRDQGEPPGESVSEGIDVPVRRRAPRG
jgi:hypothetical protein